MTLSAAGVLSVPAANITGTLTAKQISIGDYNNYITSTENDENSLIDGIISDGWIYKNTATNTNLWISPVLNQWSKENEKYRITGTVKMSIAGKVFVTILGRTADGTSTGNNISTSTINLTANTETSINEIITINSNVANCPKVNIAIYFRDSSNNPQVGYCKQMRCERMSGADLIVNGAIDADKISVSTLSAISANMGTLTAGTISYGTVGSNESFYLSNTNKTATVAGASRANLRLSVGSGFGVDKDGKLYATGATLSGALTATSLSTGTKTAATTGNGIYIDSSGNLYIGNGSTNNFTVTAAGAMTAKTGTIAGWNIDATGLRAYGD